MKKARSLIGTILAILVVVLLFNPAWLPVSQQTKDKIVELEKTHFLIQQSGRITAEGSPDEFFNNPSNPRLRDFLSKVLQ